MVFTQDINIRKLRIKIIYLQVTVITKITLMSIWLVISCTVIFSRKPTYANCFQWETSTCPVFSLKRTSISTVFLVKFKYKFSDFSGKPVHIKLLVRKPSICQVFSVETSTCSVFSMENHMSTAVNGENNVFSGKSVFMTDF